MRALKKQVANVIDAKTLLIAFTQQAANAQQSGAVIDGPTFKQVKRYAAHCVKQYRHVVRACSTAQQLKSTLQYLEARVDPTSSEFMNAIAY